MVEEFRQTIGDTDPLEMRLRKNGIPFDLTGFTCLLTLWKLSKPNGPKILNGAAMVPDGNQVTNRGVVRYTFSPADYLALPAGQYTARIVATAPGVQKTFPTTESQKNYFQIVLLPAV